MAGEDLRSGYRAVVRREAVVVEVSAGLAQEFLTSSRGVVGLAKGGCTHEVV